MTNDAAMQRDGDPMEASKQRVRDGLWMADQKARTFIAARPVTSLLVALGIGFVVGRLLRRL